MVYYSISVYWKDNLALHHPDKYDRLSFSLLICGSLYNRIFIRIFWRNYIKGFAMNEIVIKLKAKRPLDQL